MTEADFQTRFGRWIVGPDAVGIVSGGAAFELKLVKGSEAIKKGKGKTSGKGSRTKVGIRETKMPGLAFSRVEDHQAEALRRARHGVLYHKISDMALGFKPCDCVVVKGGGGWLAVMYWKPGVRSFYLIDVDDYCDLKNERGGRGSLYEEDCKRIGSVFELRA